MRSDFTGYVLRTGEGTNSGCNRASRDCRVGAVMNLTRDSLRTDKTKERREERE